MAHYKALGLDDHYAEVAADDLIDRVDAFLASGVGATLKALVSHASDHKKDAE